MIDVTEKAATYALRLAAKEKREPILNVGVQGGGCTGFSYVIEFVDTPKDTDIISEHHGLTVVCDPKTKRFIEGMTLDFDGNLLKRWFTFINPNAKSSCSCGKSFSI